MKFSFNKRKLKYGSVSTLFIILFIAVVIVVNILANFLTDRFSLKLDMTESGRYSLTDETKELLSGLTDDINIYILSTRAAMENNMTAKSALETIQRYNSESGGKVKYEFIDPNKNPAFFEKYPKARNSQARALVIEGKERYLVIESAEFAYTLGENNTSKVYYQSEEKLSSAILYVSSEEVSSAGFVTGHGETEPKALKDIFKGNNFETQNVDILSGIPADINNLVISAPTADFTPDEITALDNFLSFDGNSLYVFWSIETPSLPSLERYLAEWGIGFEPYVICDETSSYMSEVYIVPELCDTGDVKIVDSELSDKLMTISPRTRPVKVLWETNSLARVTPFLKAKSSSYGKLISSEKPISSLKRESEDISGPFTVGAVGEKALGNSGKDGIARVVAFGGADIASEDVVGISRAFNNTLLTSVVDYVNPKTLTMQISPKVTSNYDLNITEGGVNVLYIVLIYVIPLLIILAGVLVFIRRRNR